MDASALTSTKYSTTRRVPWTAGEEDLMLELLASGMSTGGIAARLSRTKGAIETRLYDVGVRGFGA